MLNDGLVDRDISEEAALWAARLQETSLNDSALNETERLKLQHWLLADERHACEFKAHNVLLALTDGYPPHPRGYLKAQVAPKARVFPRWPVRAWAVAATVAVVSLGLSAWLASSFVDSGPKQYATRTGEHRTVTFDDGSVVHLNTRTRLQWQGDGYIRRVQLIEGEALFEVVSNPEKPFIVAVDRSEIRVIGTRFNVYRKASGQVVVTVLEGRVEVRKTNVLNDDAWWVREMGAGEQLSYTRTGLIDDVGLADAHNAIRWREGVVELPNAPLSTMIEELSRYTDKQILVRDSRLAEVRVIGAFGVRDASAVLHRIERLAPIEVTETDEAIYIDYKDRGSSADQ